MMKRLALLFALYICSNLTYFGYAQNANKLAGDLEAKVDALFATWDVAGRPGVAFVLLRDGAIVYKKNYGLADIENEVPITSQTRFNLGEISAHFTAYALLKLVVEGRLTLEEPAGHYLQELNDYKDAVSVQDLLYGASGIYDYRLLKSICGWQPADGFSQEDLLRLVAHQEAPAFKPGSDFSTGATDFALLAEIIARVSGKSFKSYMEEEVFAPIGMRNTLAAMKSGEVYPNVALSYRDDGGAMVRDYSTNSVQGINNIYSCIDDLIRWERHLADATGEDRKTVELMDSVIQLANGRSNHTSLGELRLGQFYGHRERGLYSTYMTGSFAGYDASIFKFPSERFTAIALGNTGDGYNGYLGVRSAHYVLGPAFTEPETTDFSQLETTTLTKKQMQQFEGHYWDQLGELSRVLKVRNDTLRYVRTNGSESALIPLSEHRFQMKVQYDDKIFLLFPEDRPDTMVYQYDGAAPIVFERYVPQQYQPPELQDLFEGTYINKQYNIAFGAKVRQQKLTLSNIRTGDITFVPIKPFLFSGDRWFLRSIAFTNDERGNVNGFYITNNTIRNLWFEKLE